MMTIITIRHGNKDGDNLTEQGIAQIKKTAIELRDCSQSKVLRNGIAAIYCSDTNRTQQSAQAFMEALYLNLDVRVDPRAGMQDLVSEPDFMDSYKEASQKIGSYQLAKQWQAEWKYASVLRQRLLDLFREIWEKYGNGVTVVVFTHAPMAELASPSGNMPTPREGDGCIYFLEDGEITKEESWNDEGYIF